MYSGRLWVALLSVVQEFVPNFCDNLHPTAGIGANMAACAVSGGLRIGSYPLCRDALMAASGEQRKTAPMMVCAGLGAGAVGFFLAGPFFRIKNMLQVRSRGCGEQLCAALWQRGVEEFVNPQQSSTALANPSSTALNDP